jgi:folate-binding Fe-S cluster repair protein YgfZ
MGAMLDADIESAYRMAHQKALWIPFGPADCLKLSGRDTLDLLNRMSTNDLAGMTSGQQRRTVFTDALGRILDVCQVLVWPSSVSLVLSRGRLPAMRGWLASHIFFQDEVRLSPCDPLPMRWAIYGPSAAIELSQVLGDLRPFL